MSHSEQTNLSRPASAEKRHALATRVSFAVLLAAGLALGGYWMMSGRYQEATEDAYVEGHVVHVTPQTSGTVTAVHADNTDYIAAGKVLLTLNPVDARVSLQRAEAQLAKAVRQARGQFSSASQMQASIELRRADLSRALADLERRRPLVTSGAVSAEDFRHAEEAARAARAALAAAEQQFAGTQALVDRVSVADHPDVIMAAMQVRDAYIAASRAELRAPVGGMVTRRNVQVGQRVSPGATLMSIVPLDQIWVTANFKESQLRDIRVGQPVRLTADVYGSAVEYTGKVAGLDAGTGSAFSLLPAQNATGNWIKVVQRVPVRVSLDAGQLAAHPLRLGLSMKVSVDTRDRQGLALALTPRDGGHAYETRVFEDEQTGAEEIIRNIISTNLARQAAAGKASS
ncbi:efflux RND transporter periplasmic adaptor subunit [Noviherbaspirillum denitrificans]|uniref:Hemolysin D n=1 Tax=Noviherbaspirillum denitrificans TaxID=1968433 RepID=A0A254TJ11_9BURK|nr:efflux RND transporter periplasmic adaptor subunit [Noviherbaspirillum denitrificans]OWW20553.1 hemolysin D [Noviherbaspirillum denitrificans]